MSIPENKYTITYGGWYQRTTLHMSEVYNLFANGYSHLELSKDELKRLQTDLDLVQVTRESSSLEYVKAITSTGIEIRYYEDGLYILEKSTDDIAETEHELKDYLDLKFNPAISYIFSLGAPTPKVLANIKTIHPIVVSTYENKIKQFAPDESIFGKVYAKFSSSSITVFKTPKYIFVSVGGKKNESMTNLIETQIFFREFKDQLEKYLAIHRSIWEEISEVKEAQTVKGKDVEGIRGRLDGYQKTISLIENRINQMGSYVNTRSSIAKHLDIEKDLVSLFEYKFETLTDTLAYIKEIWKMTKDYLSSAIGNLVEIKSQSTSNNLKSLQTITSIGVISGVLGYLSANKLPSISRSGAIYFLILFTLTWAMDKLLKKQSQNKKYSLKFGERVSNL